MKSIDWHAIMCNVSKSQQSLIDGTTNPLIPSTIAFVPTSIPTSISMDLDLPS